MNTEINQLKEAKSYRTLSTIKEGSIFIKEADGKFYPYHPYIYSNNQWQPYKAYLYINSAWSPTKYTP